MQNLSGLVSISPNQVIAALLVAYYAFHRFDTPRSTRSQTSWFQYWGSRISYVVSCLGLLGGLTWALGKNPNLLDQLQGETDHALRDMSGIETPLVAALVMTTLLPAFPGLRELDERILSLFHKLGAIPFGAMRWAQQMKDAPFRISDALMAEMVNHIDNTAALPDRLVAELHPDPQSDKLRFKFTRNLALYVTISTMRSRARFANEYSDDMTAFDKAMTGFFAHAVGYFALAAQVAGGPSPGGTEALRDASDRFHDLTLETYDDLRLMLARILLYSCRGEHEVAARLHEIGFAMCPPKPVRIPGNQLALDLLGVVAIFVCVGTLFGRAGGRPEIALWIGMTVALNYCIAVLFAVLPKQIWSFADIRCSGERPMLSYLLSAVLTFTTILPVSFAFYCLRAATFSVPIPVTFSQQSAWLLLPTVMALVIAFACDDCARRQADPVWLTWAEALGIGGIIAFCGFLVNHVLEQAGVHHQRSVMIPIVIGASMGALFGGTIPHWYRRMLRQSGTAPAVDRSDASVPLVPGGQAVAGAAQGGLAD